MGDYLIEFLEDFSEKVGKYFCSGEEAKAKEVEANVLGGCLVNEFLMNSNKCNILRLMQLTLNVCYNCI